MIHLPDSGDNHAGGSSSKEDQRALLATFARYAALVRSQEEALVEEDLDRFEELARARQEIQDEVGHEHHPILSIQDLPPEDQELLGKVHEEIRTALLCDERIRARLQQMKQSAFGDVKTVERRGGKAKKYLAGGGAASSDRPHQLNVRL